tara:strand:- start:26 stop:274 length:249 start_codon:yes stop_codon:yes gene_type:complete
MNKDYTIYLEEEKWAKIGVYVVPHNTKITEKSLFRLRVGFIELDEDPLVFHCIDTDRMTIDVMESIVYHWRQWEKDREKSPI